MFRKSVPSVALLLLSFLFLFDGPAALAAVHPAADDEIRAKEVSLENLLNPDGTLKLDGSYSGALDLDGWQVDIDPERGPVFSSTLVSAWSSLGSGDGDGALNHHVMAIAVSGVYVYVGGFFTDVNDNGTPLPAADYIARWDGANWSALGSNGAGNGALNNDVFSIAVSGTDIYVAGWFENVNNSGTALPAADYIAKWDGAGWSALGSNGAGNGSLNAGVEGIAVSGTDTYVGGYFTDVNNNGTALPEADRVARWDGVNWSALGSNGAGDGAINNDVRAIAVSGTDVYVGGDFTNVNNNGVELPAADYVAMWDGDSWSALSSNGAGNGALNDLVFSIAINGTDVYVGGLFTNVSNDGAALPAADFVARWDGDNWSALGSNGGGNGALNNGVLMIAINGGDVYVGGQFTDINSSGSALPAADHIARWDGNSWSALGSNGAGDGALNGWVFAIASSGIDVYAGGAFTDVNNNGTVLPDADFVARYGSAAYEIYLPIIINTGGS
jgi:hypothetical protein